MRKTIALLLCALVLAMSGCAQAQKEESKLTIVCTTYPIYLFASAVTDGVEGIAVERLDTSSGSCLHDYTLSMEDMKKIEGADILVLNGAGLEDFMDDALAASDALTIDCSAGVELLFTLEHSHEHETEEAGHDHDHGDYDPHIWMDFGNAAVMVENIRDGLLQADGDNAAAYRENAEKAVERLTDYANRAAALLRTAQEEDVPIDGLITFHDGFQYFAQALDLPLLAAIEEEAGSEASAKEIAEMTQLVEEYSLPVIFTEVNGSDATANAIARETGCQVEQLTMLMDGPDDSLENYLDGLLGNVTTIINSFAGREVVEQG